MTNNTYSPGKNYVIFDLEFNQAFRCRSNEIIKQEIVEIGAVKVNDKLEVIDNFHSFIKPKLYRRLNPYMQDKTNLTIEKLDAEGKSFPLVINKFINWLGDDFVLFSWGLDDIRELRNNCTFYKIDITWINPFVDLQRIYTTLHGLPNRVSLHKAVESLNIALDFEFHSAINDALYTLAIFKRINNQEGFNITHDKLEIKTILNKAQQKEFYNNHKYRVNCPMCGRFAKKLHKKMKNSSLIAIHMCAGCKLKIRYKATPIKEQGKTIIKTEIKKIKPKEEESPQ